MQTAVTLNLPHLRVVPLALDRWVRSLPPFQLERSRIEGVVTRHVLVEEPICSRVRGLMGQLLREAWCSTGASSCEGCPVKASCDYERVWNASQVPGSHGKAGVHGFWLSGLTAKHRLEVGQSVEATITTVGPVAEKLPMFSQALYQALTKLSGDKMRLLLAAPVRLPSMPLYVPGPPASRWRITTTTPIMMKVRPEDHEECPQAPWLPRLIRRAVARLSALQTGYGGVGRPPPVDYPSYSEVRVTGGLQQVRVGQRYSRRGQVHESFVGWQGQCLLQGEAMTVLSPLLSMLPGLQVGKKTTRGFGVVDVEPLD